MYLFKNIQALQLLHDKQHEERNKGNKNKKLDVDISCSKCYPTPNTPGEQFDNFCEIYAEFSNAESFSGLTVKIFNEILRINHEQDRIQFEEKFEQLVWAFRYEKDFEKQNGDLRNLFITTMLLSEKFKFGQEETKKRMKAHYELEFGNSEKQGAVGHSGLNSERSYHGSIASEEEMKMVSIIMTSENTARMLIGGTLVK